MWKIAGPYTCWAIFGIHSDTEFRLAASGRGVWRHEGTGARIEQPKLVVARSLAGTFTNIFPFSFITLAPPSLPPFLHASPPPHLHHWLGPQNVAAVPSSPPPIPSTASSCCPSSTPTNSTGSAWDRNRRERESRCESASMLRCHWSP